MLYDFDYLAAGYTEEEWEDIPRTDKLIIRDWHLHGGDSDAVSFFGFYETDRSVREAKKVYGLDRRPVLKITLAQIQLPCEKMARAPMVY